MEISSWDVGHIHCKDSSGRDRKGETTSTEVGYLYLGKEGETGGLSAEPKRSHASHPNHFLSFLLIKGISPAPARLFSCYPPSPHSGTRPLRQSPFQLPPQALGTEKRNEPKCQLCSLSAKPPATGVCCPLLPQNICPGAAQDGQGRPCMV